jgi:hypothetical protein
MFPVEAGADWWGEGGGIALLFYVKLAATVPKYSLVAGCWRAALNLELLVPRPHSKMR